MKGLKKCEWIKNQSNVNIHQETECLGNVIVSNEAECQCNVIAQYELGLHIVNRKHQVAMSIK